jgi:hypothetical protein
MAITKQPLEGKARTGRKASKPKTRAGELEKVLKIMETQLKKKEMGATLADYIKLMQLHKELTGGTPEGLTVTWVDPPSAG